MAGNWKKRHGLAIVAAGLLLLSVCLARDISHGNRKILKQRDKVRQELILLRKENAGRSIADLPALRAYLRECAEEFQAVVAKRGIAPFETPDPERIDREQFLAGVSTVSGQLRDLARERNVVLRGEGYFGFSDVLHRERMSDELIRIGNQEFAEITVLLRTLFQSSAGDLYFIGVERESVLPGDLSSCPNDFFDARPVPTVRPILGRETHLFRFRFRCGTGTFRRFMNALEECVMPVIPHSILVTVPSQSREDSVKNQWLVVDPQPAEFSLVLEWVSLPSASTFAPKEDPVATGGNENKKAAPNEKKGVPQKRNLWRKLWQ
ncbi:MAG: Amuc_1100 family pilus-like protein [Puniceicoccales bacterium]|jgi:hypothetical protein|nr:Amuc_1100 family pilus-like protein [Puniceicoccales bacterium]